MAQKRMFDKSIIESDAFLDMPLSAQALYIHLSMVADDYGFINAPKRIQRSIGASEDDLKLLIAKHFILTFESGVVCIKHWHINNTVRKDRSKPTLYKEELALLDVKDNGAYTWQPIDNQLTTNCPQNDGNVATENRLDKNRLEYNRLDKIRLGNNNLNDTNEMVNERVRASHEAYKRRMEAMNGSNEKTV